MRAKSVLSVLLIVSLLWLVPSFVVAHDDAEHPKTGEPLRTDCFQADKPVKIDGKLDEWGNVVPAEIKYGEQVNQELGQILDNGPEDWEGAEDASAKLFVMWDKDYIYVAAEVIDDKLVADQVDSKIHQNDGLEIYFSPENLAIEPGNFPHPSHYQFGLCPSGVDDQPKQWCWCNCDGNTRQSADYITIASSISKPYKGYAVEASIRLDAVPMLAEKVKEGNTIGLHWSLNDADGKATPDARITWSGAIPHDDMFFGNITFVGPAAVSPQVKVTTTWGALKGCSSRKE